MPELVQMRMKMLTIFMNSLLANPEVANLESATRHLQVGDFYEHLRETLIVFSLPRLKSSSRPLFPPLISPLNPFPFAPL